MHVLASHWREGLRYCSALSFFYVPGKLFDVCIAEFRAGLEIGRASQHGKDFWRQFAVLFLAWYAASAGVSTLRSGLRRPKFATPYLAEAKRRHVPATSKHRPPSK